MKLIMLILLSVLALSIVACDSEGQVALTAPTPINNQQQIASILAQIEEIDEALEGNLEQQSCQNKIISAIQNPHSGTYGTSTGDMSPEEYLKWIKEYRMKQWLALSGQECWDSEYWMSVSTSERQETLNEANNNLFELQVEYQNLLQQKMELMLDLQGD